MCGQVGRPGTGLHPLARPKQRAGRLRCRPDSRCSIRTTPTLRASQVHKKFEQLWKTPLSKKPGLTVVEIINAAYAGEIRGMYIQGENPAMSDPDLDHARAGIAKLEHLVVQDIFLTETAMMADVDPSLFGLAREVRHGDQHQPSGADGPQGASPCRATRARICGSSSSSPSASA